MINPPPDSIAVTHTVEEHGRLESKHYQFGNVGSVCERIYVHPNFNFREYKTDLTDKVCIHIEDEKMFEMVNVCASLRGGIGVNASGKIFDKFLQTKQFHSVYLPEPRYAVAFDKDALTYQLGIQREYYLYLLESCSSIREKEYRKINNNEFCFSGDFTLNASIQVTLRQVLHHPYKSNLSSLWMESKVMELIALQFHFRNDQSDQVHGVLKKDREVLYGVKEYIDANIAENFSLQGLSRQFGINEFKLKSGFKAVFSSTVFDYIYEIRMQEAMRLLKADRLTVSEVARRVGYKNSNHFATAFKRRFSIVPSQLK
jgi:AraC family transcriptional activator of pyochelin receptor